MDNNILVISEKEQKAYLPYKYEEIQKIYESPNCKYNSIMYGNNSRFIYCTFK